MKKITLLLVIAFLASCERPGDDTNNNQNINSEWSIPLNNVFETGAGPDGIPALTNPELIEATDSKSNFIADTDLVIGYKNGNDIRAYSHNTLEWHEVINDNLGDVSVAITYSPLTGTGIGWNRLIDGIESTFAATGLLYNNNLIAFDAQTRSNWSQLLNESVNGSLIGTKVDFVPLIETSWKTWKTLYPNTKVVGTNTGFTINYEDSPYENYKNNDNIILFPVFQDDRLPLKERVHVVIQDNRARVYQFSSFTDKNVIIDSFVGVNYVVVGNEDFIVSFALDDTTEGLIFEYIYENSDTILTDNEGNTWNIFGEAVSGPRAGQRLTSTQSFMSYWFSVPAFYPTEIYAE